MVKTRSQAYWKSKVSEFGYISGPVCCLSTPYIAEKDVVGYCHSLIHSGLLSKSVFKNHKCIDGDYVCASFEKYDSFPYWKNIEKENENKASKKAQIKESKRKAVHKAETKRLQLYEMKINAQKFADSLGYNIKIISVKESSNQRYFSVVYVSENNYNDWTKYKELMYELHKYYWRAFKLIHQRNSEGRYLQINNT